MRVEQEAAGYFPAAVVVVVVVAVAAVVVRLSCVLPKNSVDAGGADESNDTSLRYVRSGKASHPRCDEMT